MLALVALLAIARPDPVFGGQKQIVFGLSVEPPQLLSYFIWMRSKPNEYGFSTDEYTQRMGYLTAAVRDDIFNNARVLRFDGDARAKDPQKDSDNGIGVAEKVWVDSEGHFLRHLMSVPTPKNGQRVVDAVYGTKTIEISVTENGKETTTTLYPEGGCQPFFDRFKPMVVNGKVVLKDKKFNLLDPYTLGIVPCRAEVAGRFNGMIIQTKMKGNTYDITIGGKRQRAYMADDKYLVKIDITEESFFQVDALPTGLGPGGG